MTNDLILQIVEIVKDAPIKVAGVRGTMPSIDGESPVVELEFGKDVPIAVAVEAIRSIGERVTQKNIKCVLTASRSRQ